MHARLKPLLSLAGMLVLMFAALGRADEAWPPGRLSLMVPDSLCGWEYGRPVAGWKAVGQKFIGSAGSAPLLSGWTFGDFSLEFKWSVGEKGVLVVSLPDVPSGEGLVLRLPWDGEATLSSHGQARFTAKREPVAADQMRTVRLDRSGGVFRVNLDDQDLASIPVDPATRFGLQLSAEGGEAIIADIKVSEPPGQPIFNGHDLTGWWSPLGLKSWQAKDGVIENLHKDGNYLRTEKSYGNFTLSCQYKAAPNCNSGIGIRTRRDGWPSGDGFELQILDTPGVIKDSTMSIYRNVEPLARADRSGEWNSVVIKADGPMISAWMNGQLVQQADVAHHPELKHRHPEGWIGLQDHGSTIEFRDLRVLEAPAGQGLAAWFAPRVATGPERVCDRLLNPEALSLSDGISGGAVAVSVTGPDEQVLAELTGPGAVTQIWRSKAEGKLAFYFDGAAEPAVESPANRLPEDFPIVYEQPEPLVTCLPYAKSLKIVLGKAKQTDYRIEYVTFPADVPVTTFDPDRPVLPRGWLAAIDYRGHQYSYGTHREADPEPRVSGEVKSLSPGETAPLVSATGKGIVQWLKLQGNVNLLATDDLWLEVLVDGDPQPAIAAPARYFFPSLLGGTNHENLLATFREGFASMLAMPYDDGLTIRVRNAGSKPLKRVAGTLSLIKDDPARWPKQNLDIAHRMRLRGVFHRAGNPAPWLDYKGRGRWVGLVMQTSKDASAALASVKVDGVDLPAYQGARLNSVLGAPADGADFFHLDAGRSSGLAWRYWQMAPIDFKRSLVVQPSDPGVDCLSLVYVR